MLNIKLLINMLSWTCLVMFVVVEKMAFNERSKLVSKLVLI